ncbi:MAG: glycosyltransferase [Planctomycetes bacterium]|nr:glycosyltransferase [Planctomycetota bacterium]
MRLLVYAGNLYKGGGVQVAVNFLRSVIERGGEHEWLCVLSTQLAKEGQWPGRLPHARFATLEEPAGHASRLLFRAARMRKIEAEVHPEAVFTIFGPPYWWPRAPHLCGIATPWLWSPHSLAWSRLEWRQRASKTVSNWLKMAGLCSSRWNYVVETASARSALCRYLRKPPERVHVVSNAPSQPFYLARERAFVEVADLQAEAFRFLVMAADYPHKNLDFVPAVADALRRVTTQHFEFLFTLPTPSWTRIVRRAESLGVLRHVVNAGPTNVADCPKLYQRAHALFLPTLLEAFTASYPEAMLMRRPIATSDVAFARDICRDAAIYFNPLDASEAARACEALMVDHALRRKLIVEGDARVTAFPRPDRKFAMYVDLLSRIGGRRCGHPKRIGESVCLGNGSEAEGAVLAGEASRERR